MCGCCKSAKTFLFAIFIFYSLLNILQSAAVILCIVMVFAFFLQPGYIDFNERIILLLIRAFIIPPYPGR
jgi:hypothetical protein